MVTIVIVSALSPYQELKTFKSGQSSMQNVYLPTQTIFVLYKALYINM